MWCWLLLAHWSHTMPTFGQQLAESFAYDISKSALYPAVKIKTPNLTIITKLCEFLSDYYRLRVFIGFLLTKFLFVELLSSYYGAVSSS
jgi:hypothetical protein